MSTSTTLPRTSPLPQRHLTDTPGVGGEIKQRPGDFLVEEIPLYEPCGEGEHVYLFIEKQDVSHGEMIATLCRHFGVRDRNVGAAGMKDKVGITRQLVSIHLPGREPASVEIPHERIHVHWADRHTNKLRRGHLKGNRFSIRIRKVEPTRAPAVLRILRELERRGAPAYFGEQRFGYRRNNHQLGAMLLREEYEAFIQEMLGVGASPFPEFQRERREMFDRGEPVEVIERLWTVSDRSERKLLAALRRGTSPRQAVRGLGPAILSFFASAFQSAIFNHVLDHRIDAGTLETLRVGDFAYRHDSRNSFLITEEELVRPELPERVRSLELSPSGPIWGPRMREAEGEAAAIERAALERSGIELATLESSRHAGEGARRPLRVPIRNIEVDAGTDEHGGYIRTAFDLPRGSYATVVLREVMKLVEEPLQEAPGPVELIEDD